LIFSRSRQTQLHSEGSASPQVLVDSFAFRLACYEQFHWTPETVKNLTLSEAERLAIYFEESGAYSYRKRKEASTPSSAGGESSRVEFSLGGDDEDEDY
jgi:hypothetical protein